MCRPIPRSHSSNKYIHVKINGFEAFWDVVKTPTLSHTVFNTYTLHSHPRNQRIKIKYLVCLNRSVLHIQIPHLDSEIIPGHDVSPSMAEFYIRNWRDDLRKKRSVTWIFGLFKNYTNHTHTQKKQHKYSQGICITQLNLINCENIWTSHMVSHKENSASAC